ncbi:bifunctional xylanase/deacetylase precursor [Ruminiclostridium hungatei]|uniref:Bifunctional xylanase/deacetylase n=2 Tax=Ruminiclostridium hungatei TaxID=48256 RepID=A0A1V4SJT4_RUMHU|nr:bifunctional xylanase/deacetylase precursor [Ruminiclostridium hungatei]
MEPISSLPVKTNNKIVALTFDDGPDIALTPLVLDKLDKYKVPATFMMIGQKLNDSTAICTIKIIAYKEDLNSLVLPIISKKIDINHVN